MKFVQPDCSRCEGVRACETACSTLFFKKDDPVFSSIQVSRTDGSWDINVCNQCGACIEICPVKALHRNKQGTVMVKKDICVGCFMCIGFCPTLSMRRSPDGREPFKCVSCGACVKACPTGTLVMVEKDHAEMPA